MSATVRLRENRLQPAKLVQGTYRRLTGIARQIGYDNLPETLDHEGNAHVKALEQLAETEYQQRLLTTLSAMHSGSAIVLFNPRRSSQQWNRWLLKLLPQRETGGTCARQVCLALFPIQVV